MEGFSVLALSYKNTPIEVREQVAFSDEEASQFLLQLKDIFNVEEGMVVSTCNRTEIYYTLPVGSDRDIVSLIASII